MILKNNFKNFKNFLSPIITISLKAHCKLHKNILLSHILILYALFFFFKLILGREERREREKHRFVLVSLTDALIGCFLHVP